MFGLIESSKVILSQFCLMRHLHPGTSPLSPSPTSHKPTLDLPTYPHPKVQVLQSFFFLLHSQSHEFTIKSVVYKKTENYRELRKFPARVGGAKTSHNSKHNIIIYSQFSSQRRVVDCCMVIS